MEPYPFIDLNETQLRKLADVVYNQEVQAIFSGLQFASELERAQYLNDCRECNKLAVDLLDSGAEIRKKYENDRVTAPLGNEVYSYLISGANSALQGIGNYSLRLDYLKKFTEHSNKLINQVGSIDPQNEGEVHSLTEDVALSRHLLMEYVRIQRKSNLSEAYSQWLKNNGVTFEDLVKRVQAKLKIPGLFEDLEDMQKLEVYDEIIYESGRGSVLGRSATFRSATFRSVITKIDVIIILIENAGKCAWDIFAAKQDVAPAVRDALVNGTSELIGTVIGTALATKLLVGVQASQVFVTMAGAIGGFVGAFIVSALAGLLVSAIINSGGSKILSTEGIKCFVAPMPDVRTLAYQVAHL